MSAEVKEQYACPCDRTILSVEFFPSANRKFAVINCPNCNHRHLIRRPLEAT